MSIGEGAGVAVIGIVIELTGSAVRIDTDPTGRIDIGFRRLANVEVLGHGRTIACTDMSVDSMSQLNHWGAHAVAVG